MNLTNVIYKGNGKTVYRDGDKAIKVFDRTYSKASVLNEALNQARVEETKINVPCVLEVAMVDGCWAIVFEFIEGKTLEQLIREHPKKIKHYIDIMIDLQLQIHENRCPHLPTLRDRMLNKISQTNFD